MMASKMKPLPTKMARISVDEHERLKKIDKEFSRYSVSAGKADQYMNEALACREALGFDRDSDHVSPSDLIEAINKLKSV
ncbi:MAG: hypothetical protein OXE99_03030 [Cellvibrionales bacterium]|nr:hypothetical protein [Cellvibrionales bacterium]